MNLLMLQLRIFFVANVAFTCFFVENVVITRFLTLNFTQNFWKKSSEIRRILAENLRKKLAVGASAAQARFNLKSTAVTPQDEHTDPQSTTTLTSTLMAFQCFWVYRNLSSPQIREKIV